MTTTTTAEAARISPEHARQQLTDHPHYRYRGCAPDPDQTDRAAGNPNLTLDAWEGEDFDGAENQKERRARVAAAIEVCVECPVMTSCLTWARTYRIETRADGTHKAVLASPSGILGGLTALERHREFIAAHHRIVTDAPDDRLRSPQKLALLAALAAHTDPQAVADAAGMDRRKANWHRSALVTLLGLSKKTATRSELLDAAVQRGLLDPALIVADDGTVPAVPRPAPRRTPTAATQATETAASARPLPTRPVSPSRPAPSRPGRLRVVRIPRTPVRPVEGQLELDLSAGASVTRLPRPTARTLEAAA